MCSLVGSVCKHVGSCHLFYLSPLCGIFFSLLAIAIFQGNEMLQEGLQVSIHTKTYKVRVVNKLEKGIAGLSSMIVSLICK
jgi:hypothetical protein